MEYSTTVSRVRSIHLEDVARKSINELLIPTFERLQKNYPTAKSWHIAICVDQAFDFYELVIYANINPNTAKDNPRDQSIHIQPYGRNIFSILSTISDILKKENGKYGISALPVIDDASSVTSYVFTKENN